MSSTHASIRPRYRCPSTRSTRSRPCTRAHKWALGPCVHTIFVSAGQSTALFSLLSSCFKMASDRAKWSNYVHSHISGTQSVNTTPFCASTQALVPNHQVWISPLVILTEDTLLWDLKERYGPLDGEDVSVDGLDILVLINSLILINSFN